MSYASRRITGGSLLGKFPVSAGLGRYNYGSVDLSSPAFTQRHDLWTLAKQGRKFQSRLWSNGTRDLSLRAPSSLETASIWRSVKRRRHVKPGDQISMALLGSFPPFTSKVGTLERPCILHVQWCFMSAKATDSITDEGKRPNDTDLARGENKPSKLLEQKIRAVDPELDTFLSGDMKRPLEAAKGDPVKATTASSATASSTKRRKSGRVLVLDPDKELYKQIRHMQNMQKEQARLKTATNVYRALWGNVIICAAKFAAWASSGSSAMLAEFIHSVVDSGNQALLLVGLSNSRMVADPRHPYGYGKSVYFWALVSALGTFFLGAGVSMTHAIHELMNPSLNEITWQVWSVLALSLTVDGYVLSKTVAETSASRPKNISYWKHISNIRDPATLAILLEDGAACLGVVLAAGGILASHATGNPIFDGLAGVGISSLLGAMGLALVRVNHRFLLGQSVDREILDNIEQILLNRRSIDNIGSVQSQWTGPETFSYKAEVDFDGTYLAAKLMPIYQQEFLKIRDSMDDELQVLLALYAEDVMRTVEREVRHVEAVIRKKYPGAEYIELEPMSLDVDRLAIDDNLEAELRRVESDALNQYLKSLRSEEASRVAALAISPTPSTPTVDEKALK